MSTFRRKLTVMIFQNTLRQVNSSIGKLYSCDYVNLLSIIFLLLVDLLIKWQRTGSPIFISVSYLIEQTFFFYLPVKNVAICDFYIQGGRQSHTFQRNIYSDSTFHFFDKIIATIFCCSMNTSMLIQIA